jgi:ATP-binding cassette, subfamily B, bacterial
MRTFGLLQNAISLVSFGGLLIVLAVGGRAARARRPARVLAEARFSGEAFRLFRWRAPESRMQIYLESVLAREDHAKEVKLFELGPRLLAATATSSRACTARIATCRCAATPGASGWGCSAPRALYGGYGWIAVRNRAWARSRSAR